jgi:hypothetical protein
LATKFRDRRDTNVFIEKPVSARYTKLRSTKVLKLALCNFAATFCGKIAREKYFEKLFRERWQMSRWLLRTLTAAGFDVNATRKRRRRFDLDTSAPSRFCRVRSAFVDLLAEGECR